MQHRSFLHRSLLRRTAFVVLVLATGAATRAQAQAPTFTVLHSFTNSPDGVEPLGGLLRDTAGNLYGTTLRGGSFNEGTVFKLDPAGNYTVLHSLTDIGAPDDGSDPYDAPIMDAAGNLYGTTRDGGGGGTVFRLDTSGNGTLLHFFNPAGADGANPYAGLVMDTAGNLYGAATTSFLAPSPLRFCIPLRGLMGQVPLGI
jgi:uncharacterized repeat protein (TIGR03803 family)